MTAQVRIDEADPTPPFEQLRRQLVALIRSGALPAGERLRSVRQLAADLGLASGTVARTYRELEHAGLVQTRRGAGTRVASTVGVVVTSVAMQQQVDDAVEGVVRQLRLIGVDDDSIRRALADALDRPGGHVVPPLRLGKPGAATRATPR